MLNRRRRHITQTIFLIPVFGTGGRSQPPPPAQYRSSVAGNRTSISGGIKGVVRR